MMYGGNNGGYGDNYAGDPGCSGASSILTISGQNQVKNKLILFGRPSSSGHDIPYNLQIDSIDHCVIFCGIGNFNQGTMRRAALDINNHGYIGQVSPINFGTMTPGTLTLPSGYSFPPINQAFPRGTDWYQKAPTGDEVPPTPDSTKTLNLNQIFCETDNGRSIFLENPTIDHFCYQSYQTSSIDFPDTDSNLICINPTKTYSIISAAVPLVKANDDGSLVVTKSRAAKFLYFNGSGTGYYDFSGTTSGTGPFVHGSKSKIICENTSTINAKVSVNGGKTLTIDSTTISSDLDCSELGNDLTISSSTVKTPIKVTGGSTISKITFENGKMSSAQSVDDSSTFTIVDNGKTVALNNVKFPRKSFNYVGNVTLTNTQQSVNPTLTFGNVNLNNVVISGEGTLDCEAGTTLKWDTSSNSGIITLDAETTTKLTENSSVTLTATGAPQNFSGSEIKNSTISVGMITGAINSESSTITANAISGDMTIDNSNLNMSSLSNRDSLTISGSTFENQCSILNIKGTLKITDSTFESGNSLTNSGNTLTISGSTFADSSSVTNSGTSLEITNSEFESGSSLTNNGNTLRISGSTFSDSSSVTNSGTTLEITNSTFESGSSLSNSGTTTITNSTINCQATNSSRTTLTITDSNLEIQSLSSSSGTLSISGSTFSGTTSVTNNGTTTITNSKFESGSSLTNSGSTTISDSKVNGTIENSTNSEITISNHSEIDGKLNGQAGGLQIINSTTNSRTSITNSGTTIIDNAAIDCQDFKTGNQSNTNISSDDFSLGKFENNGTFTSTTDITGLNIINNGTTYISGDPINHQEIRTLTVEKDAKLIINRHDIKSNGQNTPSIVLGKDFTVSKNLTFTSNGQLYLGIEPPSS